MFNGAILLPKSDVTVRRRLAPAHIFGMPFDYLGTKFAPIRHNWCYGASPQAINLMLNKLGILDTIARLAATAANGVEGPITPYPTQYSGYRMGARAQQKWFVETLLPNVDKGFKKESLLGSIQFLVMFAGLVFHLGIDMKLLTYILANVANTEIVSYAISKYSDPKSELSGNSIFGYTNMTMLVLLAWNRSWRSSWLLRILAGFSLFEFSMQFRPAADPLASLPLHGLGIWAGMLSWKFIYGKNII